MIISFLKLRGECMRIICRTRRSRILRLQRRSGIVREIVVELCSMLLTMHIDSAASIRKSVFHSSSALFDRTIHFQAASNFLVQR